MSLSMLFIAATTQLDSALQDAGGNRPVLQQCLEQAKNLGMEDEAQWLIINMPHLDRLEMDTSAFLGHIRGARAFKDKFDEEIFRNYLLAYRVAEEPCENWRPELFSRFKDMGSPDSIRNWIAENIKIDSNRYFFGPFPGPLSTLKAGSGSRRARCVLLVAALRSVGIPARLAKSPWPKRTWVEFYDDSGKWQPVFFQRPDTGLVLVQRGFGWVQATGRYWPVGHLKLSFVNQGEPDTSFEDFAIQVWTGWFYKALDDLYWPNENPEDSQAISLPPGKYLLTWARRNPWGEPYVRVQEFRIQAGKTTELTLETSIPAQSISPRDLMVRKLDSLPDLELSDGSRLAPEKFPCAVAFLDQSEASVRTSRQLASVKGLYVVEVSVFSDGSAHIDPDSLKKHLRVKQLPSVILLNQEREPVLWTEGFEPGLASYIRALLGRTGQ